MPKTRDRILDAALSAFAADGVAGTPITDLEEAAGLAPGSGGFYRYFRTKDEVLAAAVQREIARVRAEHPGRHVEAAPDDARDALTADLLEALAVLRALGPLMAVLVREHSRIPALAAEVADHLVEGGLRHDTERLADLMASGGIAPRDPAALCAMLTSALIGYHLSSGYSGGPPGGVDEDRFVAVLVDLVAGATVGAT